jgi:hypothetical protein
MDRTGAQKQCITLTRVRLVRIEGEHRRTAVFANPSLDLFKKIKLDGCLAKQGLTADWVICTQEVGDLIVEFKGKEIGHALMQIRESMIFWSTRPEREGVTRLAALIVCVAQKPAYSAQRQRVERELRRDFGARVTIATGNREYSFQALF